MPKEDKTVDVGPQFMISPSVSIPTRFAIITAFSGRNRELTQADLANWQGDRALEMAIRDIGSEPFRVIVVTNGGKTSEPAWGFAVYDSKTASSMARRFGCVSFFWIVNDKLQVKEPISLTFDDAGGFLERLV